MQHAEFAKKVPFTNSGKAQTSQSQNDLLSAWNLGGSNSNSILRVLKSIGLIDSSNQPTPDCVTFMDPKTGPARLAQLVRETYAPLFDASHAPHKEPDETLKRLFNIHSGGAERTLQYQVSTFKAICDFANFEASAPPSTNATNGNNTGNGSTTPPPHNALTVHIDLHIHLPPDKSRRDYEYMFEDIGRYIYGRMESTDDGR